MLMQRAAALLLAVLGLGTARADTLNLKDDAALTGRILAEKNEQVFVDLGFTVLALTAGCGSLLFVFAVRPQHPEMAR